jgi:hypothetical protein
MPERSDYACVGMAAWYGHEQHAYPVIVGETLSETPQQWEQAFELKFSLTDRTDTKTFHQMACVMDGPFEIVRLRFDDGPWIVGREVFDLAWASRQEVFPVLIRIPGQEIRRWGGHF